MKTVNLFLLIQFFFIFQAKAIVHLEGYFNLAMGFGEFDETVSANNVLDHNITSPRLGLGSRVGFDIKNLSFGGIAEIQWQHLDGRRSDQSGFFIWEKEGYDASMRNTLLGGFLSYKVSWLKVTSEYYPLVSGKITYADTEGTNPFVKNDNLSGTGFALGLGSETKNITIGFLLRRVIYDELKRQSVVTSLPSSTYTKIVDDSLSIQGGFLF